MRFYPIIIFISHICLSLSSAAFAQVTDTAVYKLNLKSTGIINSTNTGNSYLLNNSMGFSVEQKTISAGMSHKWVYGRQQDVLSNNDISSAVDFNLFKSQRKLYYWGLGTFDKSYSLKINHRFQTGVGLGYTVWSGEKGNLVITDGPLYEKGQLLDTVNYETFRNSLRVKYRFVINRITIDGINFLQQSFSDGEDYIVRSEHEISFRIRRYLSFTVSLDYNKINLTNKENLLCNFGFSFERTF